MSDRELGRQLGTLMLHCVGGRGGDVLRVIDESGLSFFQMKVLMALRGAGDGAQGPATIGDLAETLGISPASASRAVDGLVKRRLVTRSEDADDRRVRRVVATAKGVELADQIISARLTGLEEFVSSLEGEEREKLSVALGALLQRQDLADLYRRYGERGRR